MLPRLFPRADYEEDQQFGHTILTIHCLHRGFTAGAFLGALWPNARAVFAKALGRPSLSSLPYRSRILSATASGSVGGTVFLAFGMVARMWGREEIEWQERSWRILVNQGQNREDDWSVGGLVLGALGAGLLARKGGLGIPAWRTVVGGAGMGSLGGTMGHIVTSNRNTGDAAEKVTMGGGPLKN